MCDKCAGVLPSGCPFRVPSTSSASAATRALAHVLQSVLRGALALTDGVDGMLVVERRDDVPVVVRLAGADADDATPGPSPGEEDVTRTLAEIPVRLADGERLGTLSCRVPATLDAARLARRGTRLHEAAALAAQLVVGADAARLVRIRPEAVDPQVGEAATDPLTELPTRPFARERLGELLAAGTPGRRVAVHIVNLRAFHEINETLGHAAGDAVLRELAERLRRQTRAVDTVARLGGDEFTVVQPDVDHDDAPTLLARRLLALLREPVTVGGRVAWPRVSIGTAVSPDDGADADVLAANANLALRRAAAAGGNVALRFDPNADPAAHARTRRRHALAAAIDADALQVRFQPKVALGSGEVVGAEALVRWFPPDGDEIPPAEFIPLAEASGLVVPLGRHVLTQACRRAVGWPAGWRVAVNLSPIQLARDDVVGLVEGALADSGLAAHRLELEITETTLLEELDRSCDQLGRLRELGTTIALDDFGTGFSSLAMLWRLPIDVLKLDRAFLSDLDVDPRIVDVVAEVIAMARHLHLQTVAEGVETTRQRDVLRDLGCDLAQGFLFGSASADPAAHRALTPACVPVPRGRA